MKNIQAISLKICSAEKIGIPVVFLSEAKKVLEDDSYMPPSVLLGAMCSEETRIHNLVASRIKNEPNLQEVINTVVRNMAFDFGIETGEVVK